MMTTVEFLVCVAAFSSLANDRNKSFDGAMEQAVARNICAAANANQVSPKALGGIILNENGAFKLSLNMPAAVGVDVGICQANTHYQKHRWNLRYAHHPFHCADIAAKVLKENVARFGEGNWQSIAAYWSPKQAIERTDAAVAYFNRWRRNFAIVDGYFKRAESSVRLQLASGGPISPTHP